MITTEEFLRTVRQIVNERGTDFVYPSDASTTGPSFRYDTGHGVRCLIGEVMHRLGVSDETLTEWTEGDDAGSAEDLIESGRITTKNGTAARLMILAQRMQDSYIPYGIIQTTLSYATDLM